MRLLLALILVALTACRAQVQSPPGSYPQDEFLDRVGNLGDGTFRYRVYVPSSRKADVKLPVMLYLHGAGNRGDDNESQLNGLAEVIRSNREKFSFIVVIPQCKPGRFWDAKALNEANRALDDTVAELNGDPERLYLAGFSLGGYGAWTMAAMFPDKFAAIVPMSGRVLPRPGELNSVSPIISELARSSDPYEAFAERLGKSAIWTFHGGADSVVPAESSRRIIKALHSAGSTNVKYSEVAEAGHEPLAFRDPALFEWLEAQRLSNK